jgi:hypothetical protein
VEHVDRTLPREFAQDGFRVNAPQDRALGGDQLIATFDNLAAKLNTAERMTGRILQSVEQLNAGVEASRTQMRLTVES